MRGTTYAVEAAVEELKKANAGTDVGAIASAMERLTKVQHAAAESLYKQAQASGAASGASSGDGAPADSSSKKEDVIDAEVVDEK